ncbi:MAG: mannose-6-phosphate isomerase, partial [Polyangiaceae bacterium]|nr:mannose-6-phosphate isomerase [Polyangiaceae bacterium]
MEKAGGVAVVPCSCGWSDLGSWTTAWELAPKDAEGNALPEGGVAIDASGCFATTINGKVVALVGVRDLVVVDTEDAILVVPRSRAQQVKDVVAALKARGDGRV